jgi:hypothetical protein
MTVAAGEGVFVSAEVLRTRAYMEPVFAKLIGFCTIIVL